MQEVEQTRLMRIAMMVNHLIEMDKAAVLMVDSMSVYVSLRDDSGNKISWSHNRYRYIETPKNYIDDPGLMMCEEYLTKVCAGVV